VTALALLALLAGACGALGGEGPSGGTRSADRPTAALGPGDEPAEGAAAEFATDFTKHSVPYSEILSGGPPKDGILAINDPRFVGIEAADYWLEPKEPIILFKIGDDVRAHPIQIIMWHEIVNDTVGGVPVVVTFCPLCNTAIAFERTMEGEELTFGTPGRLRYSNLVMYDRQTESWWQQATGEAIAGEFTGRQLDLRAASIVSWVDFRTAHPDGKLLSRKTGFSRTYGENPYAGYDDSDNSPFLYEGPKTPGILPPTARVITVDSGGDAVAYPYDVLRRERVVNDTVGGKPVVVLWAPGTASALDEGAVAAGRDVGSAVTFSRTLDGTTLTLRSEGGRMADEQTSTEWNALGRALEGELTGEQLARVVSIDHFWFSWAAFRPDTRIYEPKVRGENGKILDVDGASGNDVRHRRVRRRRPSGIRTERSGGAPADAGGARSGGRRGRKEHKGKRAAKRRVLRPERHDH
jgi:Protein of unknown function (DUF3179)